MHVVILCQLILFLSYFSHVSRAILMTNGGFHIFILYALANSDQVPP